MWNVEAPVQVDLSQDLEAQKLWEWLTSEEQTRFNEYFNAEKEGILYLTQDELTTLKSILAEDSSASHDADFDEFIQEQKTEWLSSQDILSNIEWLPEGIWESLDTHAEEILFGSEWILNNLDLSDTARDNIITSLAMSALWKLSESVDFKWDISELFLGIVENLSLLQNVVNQRVQLPIGWEVSALLFSESGDKNYIFSDANIWKDFFDFLSGDSLSEEKIKTYIEERNLPTGSETIITNNLNGLSVWAKEDLQSILSSLWNKDNTDIDWDTSPTTTIDPEVLPSEDDLDEMEEKWGLFAMFAKMIREFMQWIIKFWEESWLIDDSDNKTGNSEDNPDEVEDAENENFDTSLPEDFPNRENIIKAFEWNPDLESQVHTIIDDISPDETTEESFDNLFGTNKSYTGFLSELVVAWDFPALQDKTLNSAQKMIAVLTEYSLYRNNIVNETVWERTKWTLWINERKLSGWNSDNVE